MSNSALVVHRGARLVAQEELDQVRAPPATETWFPLKHGDVLQSTTQMLMNAGYAIRRQQLALSRNDMRFFGTLDLESPVLDGVSLCVGIRNSTDKSFPIGFAAGSRVFVCDNLAFHSELLVTRKHTRFGLQRFQEAMSLAVQGLTSFRDREEHRIRQFRGTAITDATAEALMLRSFERGLVSHLLLPGIIEAWRKPPEEVFGDRNLWSLENCFTGVLGALHTSNPQRYCGLTIALQGFLGEAVASGEPQFAMPA